jgi:alpha-ketoglutarate-dependent taurine dioxygenase
MARTLDIEPIDASFGAVVRGIKVAEVDDETFRALYEAWLKYALLIFPVQHLARDQQIGFAKRFGPLEFEMTALSNVRSDGTIRPEKDNDDVIKVLKGNMGWHHDSTYMPVQAKGAVFSAEEVPSVGGRTGFADMRAAYDALDDGLKNKIEGLTAYHSLHYSHPETRRKSLLVGRHAHNIPGLEQGESDRLIKELVDFACQPPRIYHHDWTPGDAVVWDNRCLMHQATPWDMTQRRIMWHSRIAGDPTSEAALAA